MTSRSVLSAAILLCLTVHFSSGLELATNGGYRISIAVEEGTPLEGTPSDFIAQVKVKSN